MDVLNVENARSYFQPRPDFPQNPCPTDFSRVKGKEQETIVYEVFDTDPYKVKMAKLETLDMFNQAVIFFYQEDFVSAQKLFEKCLAACLQDTVSQKYLSRLSLVPPISIFSTTE